MRNLSESKCRVRIDELDVSRSYVDVPFRKVRVRQHEQVNDI
jgi:hypothetical protein